MFKNLIFYDTYNCFLYASKKKSLYFKIVDCKVVTTLLLANDTHNSDLRTIMHNALTITQDTRTIINLSNFHDTSWCLCTFPTYNLAVRDLRIFFTLVPKNFKFYTLHISIFSKILNTLNWILFNLNYKASKWILILMNVYTTKRKGLRIIFLFERKLMENYFILRGVTKGWISLSALIQPDSLAWKADWL